MPKIAWAVLSYSFPDLSVPIPDPLKFFPVPLSREFARIIESFRGIAADGQGELGLIPRKIPCIYPVYQGIRPEQRSIGPAHTASPSSHTHCPPRDAHARMRRKARLRHNTSGLRRAAERRNPFSLSPPFFSGPLDCAILVRIPQASDLLAFPGAMLSGLFVSRSGAHGGRAAPAAGANVSASPSVCPATRA